MASILIVEDSPTDLEALRNALEGAGHSVSAAEDATAGLEAANRDKPDLILMDVVFEGMSGFQGTRKLSRNPETADIPVIMISSKSQESDRAWGLRQGASEYLVKPIDNKRLLAAVDSLLGAG